MRKVSNKIVFIWILLAIEVYITLYGLFTMPTWGDESAYHAPLAKTINWSSIINSNSNYSSAYTPLPYIIGNIFYKVFPSLYMLRFLNWLVVLISVFIFYKIVSKIIPENRWELTLLYTVNPYLLRASFMYVMFGYGLIFALAGIYIYFYSGAKYQYFWANIFWGMAVLSMQWMLVLYAAYFFYILDGLVERQTEFKYTLKRLVISLFTLIPALLLFWQWKGFTHPNFHTHTLQPSLEHVNGILVVIGFTLFIYGLFNVLHLSYKQWRNVFFLFFLSPFLYLVQPQQSGKHGLQNFTGIVSAFLKKIEMLTGFLYVIDMTLFSIMGLLIIYFMFKRSKNKIEYFILLIITGLSIAFMASTHLGASHVFIILPFLVLYFIRDFSRTKLVMHLICAQWYFITLFYIIYIILFRSLGSYFIS